MFQWNWQSIAKECEDFLGPAGYGYIEVGSPIEHVKGDQWWTMYQLTSYKIISKFGSEQDFDDMVRRCSNAGIGVIVDTIFNHMTGELGSNVGIAGSPFSHYEYPGIWKYDDFHHCDTPGGDIQDFTNIYQVLNCELANLADLAQEKENVRDTLAAYANSLIAKGIAGMRLDAASLMDPKYVGQIISKFSRPVYITQEAPGSTFYLDIIKNGDNHEFKFSEQLNAYFRNAITGIAPLMMIGQPLSMVGWTPSDKAVVFVSNHDRERGGAITYKDPNNMYTLASVFMLGFNFGTPQVFSGYEWTDRDAGGPNGLYGTCDGEHGVNGWVCQHRWPAVAAMVLFYNKVQETDVNSYVMGKPTQIAWGRGNSGFVAINNDATAWIAFFHTVLPDGTYCDILHGKKYGNSCPATTLPPEVLLEIFAWASRDDCLLDNTPSWKNYTLSSHDPNDPWCTPSEEAAATTRAIASVCRKFRLLAREFAWRHLAFENMEQVKTFRKVSLGEEDAEWLLSRVKRLTLAMFKESVWTREDTGMLLPILEKCRALEVFTHEIVTGGEMVSAGTVILETVMKASPTLRRLHWRPVGCMQLNPTQWPQLLQQVPLLDSLDIDCGPAFWPPGLLYTTTATLHHENLRTLRLCVNEDYAALIHTLAQCELPALRNLHLRSSQHVTITAVLQLFLAHGKSLRSVAMDTSTSDDMSLSFLPFCGDALEEVVFHENVTAPIHHDTTIPNAFVSNSVKTVVVCIKDMDDSFSLSQTIVSSLHRIRRVMEQPFPNVKRLIIVSPKFDTIGEPHEPEVPFHRSRLSAELQRWKNAGVEVVNRRGVSIGNVRD
ncbi:hypothetical protein FRB99_008969 [Tulasnella sp. 403]|nr:hypothetical protein FRB99_008969 [Tulasnella sp. 403]